MQHLPLHFSAWLIVYYVIHSLLADDAVKERAGRAGIRDRTYRLAYNATALLMLIPLVITWQTTHVQFIFSPHHILMLISGIISLVLGLGVIIIALRQYDLGRFSGFSKSQVDSVEPLTTSGLNAHIRHPLYLGILLMVWGNFLRTPHNLALAAALITTAYLFIGIPLEEQKLIAQYGDAYRAYRKTTPMLFPRPAFL